MTWGVMVGSNTFGPHWTSARTATWIAVGRASRGGGRTQAEVRIDRVAADQYVPRVQLRPGDLLFFSHEPRNPAGIHHIALDRGGGRMLHAPQTGDVVRIAQFTGDAYRERQYVGACRPTAPRSRHI
ncbi:C40 family peptidase [Spirillospora sp. CA-253888]